MTSKSSEIKIYISGACMSLLCASAYADANYQEGVLIGKQEEKQNGIYDIIGVVPIPLSQTNNLQSIKESIYELQENVVGVYRCRSKQINYGLNYNDKAIRHCLGYSIFCLIEKDECEIQKTFYLKKFAKWEPVLFHIWSLADLQPTEEQATRKMHNKSFITPNTELLESMSKLINEQVNAVTTSLQENCMIHLNQMKFDQNWNPKRM